MSTAATVNDLIAHRRDVSPFPFKPRDRAEDEVTYAIYNAFDLGSRMMTRALFGGVIPASLAEERLWAVWPTGSFTPDLLLVDDRDDLRVVIENKRGAQINATPLVGNVIDSSGAVRQPMPGARADALHQEYEPEFTSLGRHEWSEECEYHLCNNYPSRGPGRQMYAPQVDAYRMTTAWVPDGFTVNHPDQLVWLFLSEHGETVADLEPRAVSARDGVWMTRSYADTTRVLLDDHPEGHLPPLLVDLISKMARQ
jgi:hypothetical protein